MGLFTDTANVDYRLSKEFVSIRIPGSGLVFVKTGPLFRFCMVCGICLQNGAIYISTLPPPPPEGTIVSMQRNVHSCIVHYSVRQGRGWGWGGGSIPPMP